jgi:hypothetical protein
VHPCFQAHRLTLLPLFRPQVPGPINDHEVRCPEVFLVRFLSVFTQMMYVQLRGEGSSDRGSITDYMCVVISVDPCACRLFWALAGVLASEAPLVVPVQ